MRIPPGQRKGDVVRWLLEAVGLWGVVCWVTVLLVYGLRFVGKTITNTMLESWQKLHLYTLKSMDISTSIVYRCPGLPFGIR